MRIRDSLGRMTVGVTREPEGYHPDGKTWVGIHLAFEEPSPPADRSDYVAEQLKIGWKFFAYELVDVQTLSLISGVEVPSLHYPSDEAERSVAASAVSAWLKRRAPIPPNGTPPETVDPEHATSIDLQHAAAGWDAPVPQWAGLTHVAKIVGLSPNQQSNVYVIPLEGEAPNQLTVEGPEEEEVITVLLGGTIATQATLYPIPPKKGTSASDAFLTLPKNPSDARRFSDALEAHACTLVNVHAVLLDAVEAWATANPTASLNAEQLKSLQDVSQGVAFDTLRIALLSSKILGEEKSLAARDGFLLADLLRFYEEEILSVTGSLPKASDIEAFRKSLQDKLTQVKVAVLLESVYKASEQPVPSPPLTLQAFMERNRALSAWVASEEGVERILMAFLTAALKSLHDDGFNDGRFSIALARYHELIRGSFNGADAVRHEVGYVVQTLAMKETDEFVATADWENARKRLEDSNWFKNRLNATPPTGAFGNLFRVLAVNESAGRPLFGDTYGESWARAIERVLPTAQGSKRFQPDSAPAPLSIRIASSPQADANSGLDDYTQDFNGVGVVIRRNDDPWSHANLVELTVPPKEPVSKKFPTAIRTFLPVAVDGRRQLDLDYRGYPLSSPAFSVTDASDVGQRENLTPGEAFYRVDDVDYSKPELYGFKKPPKLAYGHTYQWAAYNVTKAGSLPSQLQASPEAPWQPIGPIDFEPSDPVIEKVVKETYRRRTPIGAVTFGMQAGQPSRIGKSYPDVEPLAIEAQRVCVTPKTFVDLFRGSDGQGELPANSIVTFDDIRWYGGSVVPLAIEIHTDPDATSKATARAVQFHDGACEVHIDEKNSWLRVRLPGSGAGANASVTFPHPALAAGGGTAPVPGGGHRRQPPVLLIAEDNSEWLGEVSKPALIECSLSSVSYLDWEHWTNNTALEVCGQKKVADLKNAQQTMLLASLVGGLDESGAISKLVQRLPDPAVIGYVIELAVVDDVGAALPARGVISKIHSDLSEIVNELDLEVGRRSDTLKPLSDRLSSINSMNRLAFQVNTGDFDITSLNGQYTVTVPAGVVARLAVRPIVADDSVDVGVNEDSNCPIHSGLRQWALATEHVNGLEGLVFEGAELFIEAVVKSPESQDRGDRAKETQHYDRLRKKVSLIPGGPSRRYDVALEGDFSMQPWARLFSYVDIATQRWRFSGRPLYHLYRPDQDGKSSVVWVDKPKPALKDETTHDVSDDSEWKSFETELFFDRDDVDCDTRRARIGIGGSVLQTIQWDNPSATWFRHGCTFVSRYRGLLKTGGRGDRLGPPSGAPWTHRAAMLADSAGLTLTRPQVRCHVPLSRSPDEGTTPGETPPLACILEERPFAVGGLAERMLAEVAINPGYAFLNDGQRVGPLDVGREIGRDPRLETWSWMPHRDPKQPDVPIDDPTAQLVLFTEGPVGLHFEQASSPAPAWPNCQYLLRPGSLDGGVYIPDETFVGVRMRRALDPAWVVGNARGSHKSVCPRQAEKWIEWDVKGLGQSETLLTLQPGGPGIPENSISVCTFKKNQTSVGTFTIDRRLIDSLSEEGPITLCQIPLNRDSGTAPKAAATTTFDRVVVLHSGAGDGRHVLSILGIPSMIDIATGRSNAPVVLATVSWAVPKQKQYEGAELVIGGGPVATHPLRSSEPTFLEWARTARDAATIYRVDDVDSRPERSPPDRSPKGIHDQTRPFSMARSALPILAADIEAIITEPKSDSHQLDFRRRNSLHEYPVWITPPLAVSLQPLGVQRHLVGLFTAPTSEPGRRVDRFVGACRLIGSQPKIAKQFLVATAVKIVELELPAVAVRSGGGNTARIPTNAANGDVTFRLHVRFANSPTSIADSPDLRVKVIMHRNGVHWSADFAPTAEGGAAVKGVRAVDIVWNVMSTNPSDATATWHADQFANDSNALTCSLFSGKKAAWSRLSSGDQPEGLEVQLTGNAELWADISLLHSPVPKDSSTPEQFFDFNWLFTPSPDADDDPSQRLNAATLSGLTDAQSRIVSVSPPIDIHRRK